MLLSIYLFHKRIFTIISAHQIFRWTYFQRETTDNTRIRKNPVLGSYKTNRIDCDDKLFLGSIK
jgi:hypothetical protein